MAVSGSRNFIHTRNTLIQAAFRKMGVGEQTDSKKVAEAAEALNTLVASWQAKGVFLWTVESDVQILTADQESYTLDAEIIDVLPEGMYLRKDGNDTQIEVITRERYDQLPDKDDSGTPNLCYIEHTLSAIKLFLHPLSNVTTTVANGTDANSYLCIKDHTSSTDDTPITGSDYDTYWVQTTETENTVWAADVDYKSAALYYRKVLRLQDFDAAGNNPDFPVWASRALIYGLSSDLGPEYKIPSDRLDRLTIQAGLEFETIQNMSTEKTRSLQFAPDRGL